MGRCLLRRAARCDARRTVVPAARVHSYKEVAGQDPFLVLALSRSFSFSHARFSLALITVSSCVCVHFVTYTDIH